MAFRNSSILVDTTTATRILTAQPGDVACEMRTQGALDFYVGGSDVSASNGLRIENGQFQTNIRPGDEIWALSAESTVVNVRVLVRSA